MRKRDLSPLFNTHAKRLSPYPRYKQPSPIRRESGGQPYREATHKSKSPSVKLSRSRSKCMNLTSSSFTDDLKSMKSEQRDESDLANMSRTDLIITLKQYKAKCAELTKENIRVVII
jgi:hypothetical protein